MVSDYMAAYMMGGSIYAQLWYFTYTVISRLTRFSIARISITCYEDYICYLGPDRLELIMFDITEKKIDNPHSHLLLCYSL